MSNPLDCELDGWTKIVALYARRWRIETLFRELKINLSVDVLRSQRPDGIRKEIIARLGISENVQDQERIVPMHRSGQGQGQDAVLDEDPKIFEPECQCQNIDCSECLHGRIYSDREIGFYCMSCGLAEEN